MDKLLHTYLCLRRVILPEIAALITRSICMHNDVICFNDIIEKINKCNDQHARTWGCICMKIVMESCTVEYKLRGSINYKMAKYKVTVAVRNHDNTTDMYSLDCKNNIQDIISTGDDLVVAQTTRQSSNKIHVEKRFDYYGNSILTANERRRG